MRQYLKPVFLILQFLLYLGGLYVGLLGACKIDIFQVLVSKSYVRVLQTTIGIATVLAIASRFMSL